MSAVIGSSSDRPSDSEAMQPAAKRQCLEVVAWDSVCYTEISLTGEPFKADGGFQCVNPKLGGKSLCIDLAPGKLWLEMPFGIDPLHSESVSGKKPVFLGGTALTAAAEYINLTVNFEQDDQIRFLDGLEAKCLELAKGVFEDQTWVPSLPCTLR